MGFPNPSISAEAARKALVENDGSAAGRNTAASSRAALDAEELKDLERSLYYRATSTPAIPGSASAPTSPFQDAATVTPPARRGLIARLFRRG